MSTHAQWAERLKGRTSRKVANNTYLELLADGSIGVKLHATYVVTIGTDDTETLNTGGWLTVTTKARINDYSSVRVYQSAGEWFVHNPAEGWTRDGSGDVRYFDGIKVRHGAVVNAPSSTDIDAVSADRETKKLVSRYLRGMTAEVWTTVVDNALANGTSGDCWFCLMRASASGKSWGDETGDHAHLAEHLREKYYMVSLALNALTECGYREPGVIVILPIVKNAIRRYLYARLLVGATAGRRGNASIAGVGTPYFGAGV